jgi:hypothetical protein
MLLGSLCVYKHAYSCDEELEGAGHALLIWRGASKDGLVVTKHAIEIGLTNNLIAVCWEHHEIFFVKTQQTRYQS